VDTSSHLHSETGLGLKANANLLEMGMSYARHIALKKNIYLSNFTGGYWASLPINRMRFTQGWDIAGNTSVVLKPS